MLLHFPVDGFIQQDLLADAQFPAGSIRRSRLLRRAVTTGLTSGFRAALAEMTIRALMLLVDAVPRTGGIKHKTETCHGLKARMT
jgi:hypothetical protein